MAYTKKPLTYPEGQISYEIGLVNDNFEILGNSYVNGDPTTGVIKNAQNADKVDGFDASQTPTPNTIPVADNTGKLDPNWLPSASGGSSNDADKVDGFHASQTPTPNTIPVANNTGKLDSDWLPPIDADKVDGFDASQTPTPNTLLALNSDAVFDLSTSFIKSNVYTFRRVDLTDATSDYDLQVGEEAIYTWDTNSSLQLPLRIACAEGIYEMIIWAPYQTSVNVLTDLLPNNTTYSNAFTFSSAGIVDGSASTGGESSVRSSFYLKEASSGGVSVMYFSTYVSGKFYIGIQRIVRYSVGGGVVIVFGSRWNDTTTAWTSFGTLTTSVANETIRVIVRRLV